MRLLLLLLLTLAASSCSGQPKSTNFKLIEFSHVTVFEPITLDSAGNMIIIPMVCDSTMEASAFLQDSLLTITLKGGSLVESAPREFLVMGNLDGRPDVFMLKDKQTLDDVLLFVATHKDTGETAWFLKLPEAVVRLTDLSLSCDEL